MFQKIFYILCVTIFTTVSISQAQKYPACDDAKVHELIVTRNNYGFEKNYSLILMHQTIMLCDALFPVSMQLEEGVEHIINFAPHPNASKVSILVMDKDKKIVSEAKGKNLGATAKFTPAYTGPYYIIVSQKVRKVKNPCGAVSIMAKGNDDHADDE